MKHFGAVFKLDLTEETRTQLQEEEAVAEWTCWKLPFSTTLSFDAPSSGNHANVRISLHCQKLESLRYIFVANSAGLSSFSFFWWVRKRMYCETECNDRSRSSKVVDFGTNRKRVRNFLLGIDSNLEWPFYVKFCFAPVCLELRILALEAWLLLNLYSTLKEENSCGIARFPYDSKAFLFRISHQDFAVSFRSVKKFYIFKTIAHNADVLSLCAPNSLDSGTYSKGDLDLDLDSSRIQLDTLGHTPTPSVSVKSCHLCFLPGEPHLL